jgi:hypothetical protein
VAIAELGSFVRVKFRATPPQAAAWAIQGLDLREAAFDAAHRYCNSSAVISEGSAMLLGDLAAHDVVVTSWPPVTDSRVLPCANPAAWWDAIVSEEPVPLWGKLSPIANLLSSSYFPQEPLLKRKRQALVEELRRRVSATPSVSESAEVRSSERNRGFLVELILYQSSRLAVAGEDRSPLGAAVCCVSIAAWSSLP